MTGNGNYIYTYKHGDDWGMVYDFCVTHITRFFVLNVPSKAFPGDIRQRSPWPMNSHEKHHHLIGEKPHTLW